MTDVEYLVEFRWQLPPNLTDEARGSILEAERARGRELQLAGAIRRIWRLPGERANLAIWVAASPTQLHEYIASLPLFPWSQVSVRTLATHPLEAPSD